MAPKVNVQKLEYLFTNQINVQHSCLAATNKIFQTGKMATQIFITRSILNTQFTRYHSLLKQHTKKISPQTKWKRFESKQSEYTEVKKSLRKFINVNFCVVYPRSIQLTSIMKRLISQLSKTSSLRSLSLQLIQHLNITQFKLKLPLAILDL